MFRVTASGTPGQPRRATSREPLPTADRRADKAAFTASVFYGVAMTVLLLLQYLIFDTYSSLPFFCLLAFFIHLAWLRHSVSDPFTIMLLFGFIYSAFPLLFGIPGSWSALKFGFDGAAIIYAVGSVSMIFGVALAIAVIPHRATDPNAAQTRVPSRQCKHAGLSSAIVSLALTAIYVAKNGSVLNGDMTYGDSFEVKMKSGAGLLFLSTPLAGAAVAFLLASNVPLRVYHHALALAAYVALYIAHGQRKFFIIPAVLYAARYLRIGSLGKLLIGISVCSIGLTVFMYLGFLRTSHAGFSQVFNPIMMSNFANTGSQAFSGESVGVFSTASAAYDGFVRGLPFAGDYWRSWMMSIPHFIMPHKPFEPLNERFAYTYMPYSRVTGMGWGFSFFGEAYLVGGYPVVVAATFLMMLFFRWIYILGGRDCRSGLIGAISLSVMPFTFWFQRNAFAYFVKEFLIGQVGITVLVYFCAAFLIRKSKSDPARSRAAARATPLRDWTLVQNPGIGPYPRY